VRRITLFGRFGFWDEELVLNLGDGYGSATHAYPRCVFCVNAAAVIISQLSQVRSDLLAEFETGAMLRDVLDSRPGIDKH
jgi:hypothetical protein